MLPLANEPFSFILFVTPATDLSKPVFTAYVDPIQKGEELPIELDVPDRAKHAESGDLEARLTILRGVAQTPAGGYRESFSWEVLPDPADGGDTAENAAVAKAAMEEAAVNDGDGLSAFIAGCWRTAQFVASSTGRFPKTFPPT